MNEQIIIMRFASITPCNPFHMSSLYALDTGRYLCLYPFTWRETVANPTKGSIGTFPQNYGVGKVECMLHSNVCQLCNILAILNLYVLFCVFILTKHGPRNPIIPQQAPRSVAHLVFKCLVPVFEA